MHGVAITRTDGVRRVEADWFGMWSRKYVCDVSQTSSVYIRVVAPPAISDINARLGQMTQWLRTEPVVSACIQRLINSCLAQDIKLTERGADLKPALHKMLTYHYTHMLRQAIEIAVLTGFVPFYVRRRNGVPLPFIPELGTFTWSVEVVPSRTNQPSKGADGVGIKRRRFETSCLVRYRVRMNIGDVKDDEVNIVPWQSPIVVPDMRMPSPMQYLFTQHELYRETVNFVIEKERWNTHKHLVVTEKLDLKDPTPSGMQLLDDVRRYSLTGQHNMMQGPMSHYYSRRDKSRLESVVDANHAWVNSEFMKDDSSAQAVPHIMPPNSETSELTPIVYNDVMLQMREQYIHSVNVFFTGASTLATSHKYFGTSGTELTSRSQQAYVLGMCRFLEHTAAMMYCACFDVAIDAVHCSLTARSRLEITSVADIKALVECGVMTDQDKARVRSMYIGNDMDV